MLIRVPSVLPPPQAAALRARLDAGGEAWVDGRATAGYLGARVKHNQQLAEHSSLARAAGDEVLAALERHPLFISAVLPKKVYPPLFNRYGEGMHFGSHIDNAVRLMPGGGARFRTDVSATLFLSAPEEYEGGELVIEDTYGLHSIKLPMGDMVALSGLYLRWPRRLQHWRSLFRLNVRLRGVPSCGTSTASPAPG